MTSTQVTDNIMFAAVIQQLTRLATQNSMTNEELELVKKDLERRLRPTILAA